MPPSDKDRAIGAVEQPEDFGPSIIEGLPTNKTLIITKLTESAPGEGEEGYAEVQKVGSLQKVFDTYQPSLGVNIEGVGGESTEGRVRFRKVDDFGNDEALFSQLPELQQMREALALNQDLLDEVTGNEALRKELADPAKRQRLVDTLKHYLEQLNKME
jgi:Type VI secretion system, VipA, VC_A0107 or Hcp2